MIANLRQIRLEELASWSQQGPNNYKRENQPSLALSGYSGHVSPPGMSLERMLKTLIFSTVPYCWGV
jgi:hypothetical protein